jgi:putative ABC transport system substrate-binding protein
MQFGQLERREFILLLGATTVWPLVARSEQRGRLPRVGLLIGWLESETDRQVNLTAFRDGLRKLGWIEGRNVHLDYRWTGPDSDRVRAFAAELVDLGPDVLWTTHTPLVKALGNQTGTIPIVFAALTDPIGTGLVSNLAHPGGNITGFTAFEYSLAGKWLGLLKEVAPTIVRVAFMLNPAAAPFAAGYMRVAEEAAPALGVQGGHC